MVTRLLSSRKMSFAFLLEFINCLKSWQFAKKSHHCRHCQKLCYTLTSRAQMLIPPMFSSKTCTGTVSNTLLMTNDVHVLLLMVLKWRKAQELLDPASSFVSEHPVQGLVHLDRIRRVQFAALCSFPRFKSTVNVSISPIHSSTRQLAVVVPHVTSDWAQSR